MAANQFFMPYRPAYDGTGLIVPGSQVYFTLTGTNTPSAPFTTSALSTHLSNPVIADAAGKLPPVYIDAAKVYRVRIYARGAVVGVDTPIEEYDPYVPGAIDALSLEPVADAAAASATAAATSASEAAADAAYVAGIAELAKGDPGGNIMAIGLLAAAATLNIPAGTDLVQTSGNESLRDQGAGLYIADPSVNSAYLAAHPKAGFVDAGGRGFRVLEEAPLLPQQFYLATDANFGFAINRALAYLRSRAQTGYGYGDIGASKLFIPRSNVGPYLTGANTHDLDFGVIVEGESVGGIGPGATVIKPDVGVTCFRAQKGNTSGATGIKTPVANSGIILLRNLTLDGQYAGGAETAAYGIHARETIYCENLGVYNFSSNNIHVVGSSGGGVPTEGAPNECHFINVFSQGGLNGFFFDGADANAATLLGCKATYNRQWGFYDSSFLGCAAFLGCRASTNGRVVGATPTAATYSSKLYMVRPGQAAGATTNAPSGTTASNTWWDYIGPATTGPGIAAWDGVQVFREGGGFKADDPNQRALYAGCYNETDQNMAQICAPNQIEGGFLASVNKGTAGVVTTDTGGNFLLQTLLMQSGLLAVGTTIGTDFNLYAVAGSGGRMNASSYLEMLIASSRVGYWDTNGLNLDSGKVVTVNGNRVLSARGASLPADATDLATAMALVNAIKARGKVTGGHGLWSD